MASPFVVLTGVKEALRKMERAGKPATQRRILRRAIGKATKLVLDAAKAKAPKRTGLLRQSLGRKTVTFAESGTVVGIVGPRRGFRRALVRKGGKLKAVAGIKAKEQGLDIEGWADPLNYAHLVEYGHQGAAAKPFMRPAWDATRKRVEGVIGREVALGTIRELLK